MSIIETTTDTETPDPNPTGDTPEGAPAPAEDSGNAPLLAGKYKTVEELEKGYSELQKLVSSGGGSNNETDAPDDEGSTTGDGDTPKNGEKPTKEIPEGSDENQPEPDDALQVVEKAGLKWEDLSAEYTESGHLSDESYASLKKVGWPREVVDSFIRGRQAEATEYDNAVYSAAGDGEGYADLVSWATDALTLDEKKAFNASITSGNKAQAVMAVEALVARRSRTKGAPPKNLLDGKGGAVGGSGKPYRSYAELTAAMNDPRYRNDPAYRKDVQNRLAVSDIL